MLTACGSSAISSNHLPPLPSTVENASPPTPWPKSPTLDDKEATLLLGQCRASELEKWRAIEATKRYHKTLQKLYEVNR